MMSTPSRPDRRRTKSRVSVATHMFRAFEMLIFTLLLLGTSSCDDGETSDTVRGTILDKQSLAPIESAWVNGRDSDDGARFSDADGRFAYTVFGRVKVLYAGKSGYVTRLIDLPEGATERQNIIVELESQ